MKNESKKVVSALKTNNNINDNLIKYRDLLGTSYNHYSMVKSCLNYFTMKETISEYSDDNSDVCGFFNSISEIVKDYIVDGKPIVKEALCTIKQIRDTIERKMHILTAFTDGYEVYEYILNRVEARVTDTVSSVDIDKLSAKMFQYVFSENDTVVINSKLQLIMSQLPVRMTKNKFFDILSNTLNIYNAGETKSLDEFIEMLESTALLKLPEGFETEYPELYTVYVEIKETDYKTITKELYIELKDKLENAAKIIETESTAYILLQEIVNDVYCILLTSKFNNVSVNNSKYYASAYDIYKLSFGVNDFDELPDELMDNFISIEGVQEKIYENIMILESSFDEIIKSNQELIDELNLTDDFSNLKISQKLVSTSLFININETDDIASQIVDNKYIRKAKDRLISEFTELFSANNRIFNRSIMCKILSCMPIFMNTQQEIKDYFDYVLQNCKDDSELTACNKLICDIIEEV